MPYCARCGSQVAEGTAYCSRCGAPISAGAAPGDVPPPPPSGGPAPTAAPMAPNVAGLLCYVLGFITGIIFLVLEPYKNDRFVRFHAFQSIFYSVALTVFWIIWGNLFWIVGFGFFWTILSLISTLVWLGAFLLWLFLMFKAYNGQRFVLPVLGELAAKQAG